MSQAIAVPVERPNVLQTLGRILRTYSFAFAGFLALALLVANLIAQPNFGWTDQLATRALDGRGARHAPAIIAPRRVRPVDLAAPDLHQLRCSSSGSSRRARRRRLGAVCWASALAVGRVNGLRSRSAGAADGGHARHLLHLHRRRPVDGAEPRVARESASLGPVPGRDVGPIPGPVLTIGAALADLVRASASCPSGGALRGRLQRRDRLLPASTSRRCGSPPTASAASSPRSAASP